jgi:hypothetical protein
MDFAFKQSILEAKAMKTRAFQQNGYELSGPVECE